MPSRTKKNKVMLLMSLYQFFTSHEPNYIHKSIYGRVSKAAGRWVLSKSNSKSHILWGPKSCTLHALQAQVEALKYFCKKLR